MSWDRLPSSSMPLRNSIDSTVDAVLYDGAVVVRDHLEAGTPIRTGRLQGGWEVERIRSGFQVGSQIPYNIYVDVDSRVALTHIDEITGQLGRSINRLFGRNHG